MINELVDTLAPAMVVSVALQHLIELLDPVLEKFIKVHKKWILSAVSLVISLLITGLLNIRILVHFDVAGGDLLDLIITALFLSGGTKAFNDLIKLAGYRKEVAKVALTPQQIQRV